MDFAIGAGKIGVHQIIGCLWAVFFAVWLIWAFRTKPLERREPISSSSPYVLVTLAGSYLMIFGARIPVGWLHAVLFPARPWIEIVGIVLTAAGIGFAIWARVYLAGNWSGAVSVRVGHELIRTGPYRWVRHPIYSGLTLALLGTALGMGEVRGFVAVVVLYAGFKIKSRLEERVMRGVFGLEYEDYSRRTGAILPRLHV
jgi:protein-S-isoprenylcysteine O-methyltransferase Ste14